MVTVSRRHFFGQGAAGAAAIALGARVVGAQEWAKAILDKSPRKKEWVTVKSGARTVDSFLAQPQSTGKAPGIIVIHEIFGMTDWVQNVTDELKEGDEVMVKVLEIDKQGKIRLSAKEAARELKAKNA